MTVPAKPTGRLLLVPTPLDHGCDSFSPLDAVLPLATIQAVAALDCWVSENAKSTRAFLKRVADVCPLATSVQEQQITELPREAHKKGDHGAAGAARVDARALLAPALQGRDVGLISEAGMPAIADPGSSLVRAAHELGLTVVPLSGPVSLMLALAASGLNGQHFAFVGYLPREGAARQQRIQELEKLALRTGQTQLFIETPYRNAALLQALAQQLQPGTRLAVASGLTLPAPQVRSMPAKQWRDVLAKAPADAAAWDQPAVFALGA
ncbi:SAM-dependent methyltransferase [Ottowia oryzae]|uniref:Ribosomal RNA small subunit methyltransferase I n=1 Tax=Ottowia oryzae TaxID=2109914 RepID=A0A2S0MHC8_9BURK|nr:SAM-dependent methyltransferase [Ottowia oryzae]AVO35113.1 ribosomal RNA small subunit methyltransferase I [Ottowia oryzae]